MAIDLGTRTESESFLLDLLRYAGWRLQVHEGETVRIRATRGDVELDVTRASLSAAAATVFARAMRSGGRRAQAGTG